MIISQTPFRLSFMGGGTDFKDFYQIEGGAVISTTINKFLYVTVNEKFDGKVHVRYSEIEEVLGVNEIKHPIIREALKLANIDKGIEIVTISDIPTKGSGLGSSSALSVGLLNALFKFKGYSLTPQELATLACKLELEILESPIGKQDQCASAVGSFKKYIFNQGGSVDSLCLLKKGNYGRLKWLEESSMLFYLGFTRSANKILQEHKESIPKKMEELKMIKYLVSMFESWILGFDTDLSPQEMLNLSWEKKKELSYGYSSPEIDKIVLSLKKINNVGVKLCGAGGGGFVLVIAPLEEQTKVRNTLKGYNELKFNFSKQGSRIIYNDSVHS